MSIKRDNLSIRMILTLLQTEYPNSFAGMDDRTMVLKVELWEQEFRQDDIRLVYAAVRLYMKNAERFAPSIGQVRENMRMILKSEANELTDQDAWAMVSRACANGIHHSQEEFDRLPPDVQRAVGGPEQLKAWGMMDSETVESVVASNFKRTFRTYQERKKQDALIPAEMKAMFSGIAQNLSIEGGSQKQIAAPKEKLVSVELEPLIQRADQVPVKQDPQQPGQYRPPDSDEWERRREAAMKRLNDRHTERIDSNDSRKMQGNSPDLVEHTG